MKQQSVLAFEKLLSHSGLSIPEVMMLEKNNIDLVNKTIICKSQKHLYRKATIRPDDVQWFESWMHSVTEKLFPYSERTIYHNFKKIGILHPSSLRKKLWDEMLSLKSPAKLIAVKLGYFVCVENQQEKSALFSELQSFEKKHFGGTS